MNIRNPGDPNKTERISAWDIRIISPRGDIYDEQHFFTPGYSRSELCDLLAIGEAEFRRYYIGSDDILETLGIDDIL